MVADFPKEYGIKVNYDVFDSNEVLETKLLTGHTNYDVVAPSGPFLARQIQAGVFQKLNKALLPNLDDLDPAVAKEAQYDPGNAYAVTYMWITSGPGYNTAKIKQRMPDAPVDSWRMLYDPAVVAKFADCGVSLLDAPDGSDSDGAHLSRQGSQQYDTGRHAGRGKGADGDPSVHPLRAFVALHRRSRQRRDLSRARLVRRCEAGARPRQGCRQGHRHRVQHSEGRRGQQLRRARPSRRMRHTRTTRTCSSTSCMRPEIAARNSNLIKYANGDTPTPAINEAVRNDPGVYPPPDVQAKLHPEPAGHRNSPRVLTRMWTRFKTGK